MGIWAIINNNIVVNSIVADAKEIAESSTSLDVIEITSLNPIGIGWYLENDVWYAPKPLDGKEYTWDYESKKWYEILP